MTVTLGLAFAAGLISFISPCVLPLVPAYLGYMGSRAAYTVAQAPGTTTAAARPNRLALGLHSVFFVLGFSLVFVGVGLLSTTFIRQVGAGNIGLAKEVLGRAGGLLVILFGLHFMGALPWLFGQLRRHERVLSAAFTVALGTLMSVLLAWALVRWWLALPLIVGLGLWLALGGGLTQPRAFWLGVLSALDRAFYADTRAYVSPSAPGGLFGTASMGVVFAAGWTPCIGPIYGSILTVAANAALAGEVSADVVAQSGVLLGAYALGLGVPFVVAALLLDGAAGVLARLRRAMGAIKVASGAFLVLVGVLVASGTLQTFSVWTAQGSLGALSYRMEDCLGGWLAGQRTWAQVAPCLRDDPMARVSGGVDQALFVDVGLGEGAPAPLFETFTDNGATVSLSALRGQVVVLNFWATWCVPCAVELPALDALAAARAADGLAVVAVNNREGANDVRAFREAHGLMLPLALDLRGAIQDRYGVIQYPVTYIIGRDGRVVTRHFGALDLAALAELVEAPLRAAAPRT